jgi:hypothetical protein
MTKDYFLSTSLLICSLPYRTQKVPPVCSLQPLFKVRDPLLKVEVEWAAWLFRLRGTGLA